MNETSDDAILRKGEDGKIRVYFDKNQKMVVPASINFRMMLKESRNSRAVTQDC